jgi:hypothetical protein
VGESGSGGEGRTIEGVVVMPLVAGAVHEYRDVGEGVVGVDDVAGVYLVVSS